MSGDRFGKFELKQRLGVGGMAEVWLAFDTESAQLVVIKRALPQLAEPQFKLMLQNEARMLMMLDHPNVVRMHEVGELLNITYISMEYVDGNDLFKLLRQTHKLAIRTPVAVALRVTHEVCLALSAAHSAMDPSGRSLELVHRDVSPHNVMVSVRGEVKLVDFGVVKVPGVSGHTEPGTIKGKFAYMAPEQAADQPLDGRTDLFAAGLVLYEMLSGQRAYKQEIEGLIFEAAREGQIEPIEALAPDLPVEVVAVVTRALEKDPGRRFQTAEAFAEALKACGGMASREEVSQWREHLVPSVGQAAVPLNISQAMGAEPRIEKAPPRSVPTGPQHPFSGPELEPLELMPRPKQVEPLLNADLYSEKTQPFREMPTSPQRGSSAMAVIAVVVALGVGGLLFMAIGQLNQLQNRARDTALTNTAAAVAPPGEQPVNMARQTEVGPDAMVPDAPMNPPPDDGPMVHLFIDSEPSGALVLLNGAPVGRTPWGGDAPAKAQNTLGLSLEKYQPWSQTLEAGAEFTGTVKLKR